MMKRFWVFGLLLCVFALQPAVSRAGDDDPVPLTREKAEEKKKEIDGKAGGDASKRAVILAAAGGDYFVITVQAARFSETLRNLLEDAGDDNPLPVPNINNATAARVAICLHRLAKGEDVSAILRDVASTLPMGDLQELLVAFNYLDAPLLTGDIAIIFARRFLEDAPDVDGNIFGDREAFKKRFPNANLSNDILQMLFAAARITVIPLDEQRRAMQAVIGDDEKYAPVRKAFEKEHTLKSDAPIVERNILLVGRSRSGKTTLAHMVQNYFHVAPTMSLFRGTKDPGIIRVDLTIDGTRYRFNFIDTPGLFEAKKIGERARTNEELLQLIKKELLLIGKQIHLALFTFSPSDGINSHDMDALQQYLPVLQTVKWIPVITRAEGLIKDSFQSIELQLRQHPRMSKLLEGATLFFSGALEKNDTQQTLLRKAGTLYELRAKLILEIINHSRPVPVADMNWPLPRVVAERNDRVVQWRSAASLARDASAQELPKAPAIWFQMCRPKSDQKKCEEGATSIQKALKAKVAELDRLLDEYAMLAENQLPNDEMPRRIQALLKEIEDMQAELIETIPGITKAVSESKKDD